METAAAAAAGRAALTIPGWSDSRSTARCSRLAISRNQAWLIVSSPSSNSKGAVETEWAVPTLTVSCT